MSLETLERAVRDLQEQTRQTGAQKFWDVATKLALPAGLALAGWIVAIDSRLAIIEVSIPRNGDLARLMNELRAEMREQLAPAWLRTSVEKIEQGVDKVGTKLEAVDRRLTTLEARSR